MPSKICPCSTAGVYGKHAGELEPLGYSAKSTTPGIYACQQHKPFYLNNGYVELKPKAGDVAGTGPVAIDLLSGVPLSKIYTAAWDKVATEKVATTVAEKIVAKKGKYKAHADPYKHSDSQNSKYFCESGSVGADGTTDHWGKIYHFSKANLVFVCMNHLLPEHEGMVWDYVSPGKGNSASVAKAVAYKSTVVNWKDYELAKEHRDAIGSEFYCEKTGEVGANGKTAHSGYVYLDSEQKYGGTTIWCSNHKPAKITDAELLDGIKFLRYGNPGGIAETKYAWIPCSNCGSKYAKGTGFKAAKRGRGGRGLEKLCSSCAQAYKRAGYSVVGENEKLTIYEFKTQKGKGISALASVGLPIPEFIGGSAKDLPVGQMVGKFVRPCPMRPRHGFVDSRLVKTVEEAEKVRAEALAADPDAELVCMPFIDAPYSGIWTEGNFAIGKGHDGATGGSSAITIPVSGDLLQAYVSMWGEGTSELKEKAGIRSAPYVETLWTKGTPSTNRGSFQFQMVQLRDGPKLEQGAIDFVPEPTKVERVLLAQGDLLEWEETMKKIAPGTVVYHPNGSMASHFAIHAVLNRVPLMISREPKVGEILEPTKDRIREFDLDGLKAGFIQGLNQEMTYPDAMYLMLAALHHALIWKGREDTLLGAGMGAAYRLAFIAAGGECRHLKSSHLGRETVYGELWNKVSEESSRALMTKYLKDFLFEHWKSGGFGGKAWYNFIVHAAKMYNALLGNDPMKAIEELNQLVHSAHNGGWGFNKFMTTDQMTITAKEPVYAVSMAGPVIYKVKEDIARNEKVLLGVFNLGAKVETFEDTPEAKRAKANIVSGKTGHVVDVCKSCGNESDDCDCDQCPHCGVKFVDLAGDHPSCKYAPQPPKKRIITDGQYRTANGKMKGTSIHVQYHNGYQTSHHPYWTKDVSLDVANPKHVSAVAMYNKACSESVTAGSLAGSDTQYALLVKKDDGWYAGDLKVLPLEEIK